MTNIEYQIDSKTGVCLTPCPFGAVTPIFGQPISVGSTSCQKCQYFHKSDTPLSSVKCSHPNAPEGTTDMSNENVGSDDASKKREGAWLPPLLRLDPVPETGWHYFAEGKKAYLVDGYVLMGQHYVYHMAVSLYDNWVTDYAESNRKPNIYGSAEWAKTMCMKQINAEEAREREETDAQIDEAVLLLKKVIEKRPLASQGWEPPHLPIPQSTSITLNKPPFIMETPTNSSFQPTVTPSSTNPDVLTLFVDTELAKSILQKLGEVLDEHYGNPSCLPSMLVAVANLLAVATGRFKDNFKDMQVNGKHIPLDFEHITLGCLQAAGQEYGLDFGKWLKLDE